MPYQNQTEYSLKTDISFLDQDKQDELNHVVERIVEELNPLVVILYGSYARNEWVEDYQANTEYVSDFDLLIITRVKTDPKDERKEDSVISKFKKDRSSKKASIIAHSLHYLNKKIEERQYFFYDIYKEGIVLYNRDNLEISSPKELSISQRKNKARKQFDKWYRSGIVFLKHYEFGLKESRENEDFSSNAAFQLHQAVEHTCAAILLCYTDYKPKTHDLEELEKQIIKADFDFFGIFPKETEEQRKRFEKLREAYVRGRYDATYSISEEELIYLGECVKNLIDLAKVKCEEKIAFFEEKVGK